MLYPVELQTPLVSDLRISIADWQRQLKFVGSARLPFTATRPLKMEDLANYLNDHLAGSVGALELLDRMIEACEGKPLERFLRDLRGDIHHDQEQLKELIVKLGIGESTVRKAGAWVAEKLTRPKIDLGDGSRDQVGIFLALEALVLGITGKRSLWRALQCASRTMPELARLDYSGLEKRAIDQCEQVEARRLEIARAVFKRD